MIIVALSPSSPLSWLCVFFFFFLWKQVLCCLEIKVGVSAGEAHTCSLHSFSQVRAEEPKSGLLSGERGWMRTAGRPQCEHCPQRRRPTPQPAWLSELHQPLVESNTAFSYGFFLLPFAENTHISTSLPAEALSSSGPCTSETNSPLQLNAPRVFWSWAQKDSSFIFLGSRIAADSDCSHESERCLLLEKSYETPRQRIKKQRHHFANNGPYKSKLWFF